MTFRDLYNQAVNLSREERVQLALYAGNEVFKYLETLGKNEEERVNFLYYMTALFAGADGVIDDVETKLFNEITGANFSQAELNEGLKPFFNPDFVAGMDKAIDTWDAEAKMNVCRYGLAFLSADGEISAREQQVFEKIWA